MKWNSSVIDYLIVWMLYRWGRRILEQTTTGDEDYLCESDQRAVREVLLPVVGAEAESEDLENKVDEMCSLLSTWKLSKKEANEEEEEDLRLEEVQGSHQVRMSYGSSFEALYTADGYAIWRNMM